MIGVSGTGIVAIGATSISGESVLVWLTEYSSVAFYKSLDDLRKIHCHHDATQVRWIDEHPDIREQFDVSFWETFLTDLHHSTRAPLSGFFYGEAFEQLQSSREIIAARLSRAKREQEQQVQREQVASNLNFFKSKQAQQGECRWEHRCGCGCSQESEQERELQVSRIIAQFWATFTRELEANNSKLDGTAQEQNTAAVSEAVAQCPDAEEASHRQSAGRRSHR